MPPNKRVLRRATVTAVEWISPELVRLSFTAPDLIGLELPFTDHYIKIAFAPKNAPYSWPFDGDEVRAKFPDFPPVTRTYSLRSFDTTNGTMEIDFVAHGSEGLAGPWAAKAEVGAEIGFFGPGGAWAPQAEYDHYVLVGDEAAAPAVCAGLEAIPAGKTAVALLEISSAEAKFEVPTAPGIEIVWVPRNGAPYGQPLAAAVRDLQAAHGQTSWFVHGVAEMVKDLRRYLFVELGQPKSAVSISGYWRTGMTEDGWQSSKREFVAGMEQEEAAAAR